jgi:hypothetical protein
LLLRREILADTVRLSSAACVGRHELFDPIVGSGHRYRNQERVRLTKAARVCVGCPVIRHCTSVTLFAD